MNAESERASDASVSGRVVVIAMFGFAVLLTGFLWYYWNRHLEPFMPMQKALAEQFGKESRPRVDGGQKRMSKRTPTILRVQMESDFDPLDASRKNQQRIAAQINAIVDTARRFVDLDDYELFVVHFYQKNPEREIRQQTFESAVADLPVEAVTGAEGWIVQ